MAGRSDEVEKSVDTIVTETRITLDTGLFCQNIIVLSLKITNNFAETSRTVSYCSSAVHSLFLLPGLIVNLVAKSRCVNDGQ